MPKKPKDETTTVEGIILAAAARDLMAQGSDPAPVELDPPA